MTINEIKEKLSLLNIKPLKSLGQNFLIDKNIIDKICQHENLEDYDYILEIGPGLGSLTKNLSIYKENLKIIELDKTLADYWQKQDLKVYHQDALKFDWVNEGPKQDEKSILISNLPYQISSRLLVDLFCQPHRFNKMILMFQKEVGERLRAMPEDKKVYGLISVLGQIGWKIKTITKAPRQAFYPAPEIESVVLGFEPNETIEDSKGFVQFLKTLFAARRKKISGSLKKMGYKRGFEEVGDLRPDHLAPKELLELFAKLQT